MSLVMQRRGTIATAKPPAIAFVKEITSSTSTADPAVLTVPAGGVAAGNTIVLFSQRRIGGVGAFVTGVTDSKGNTYTLDRVVDTNDVLAVSIASGYVSTPLVSGDTISVDYAGVGTGSYCFILAAEFTRIVSSSSVDKVTGAAAASGTAIATGLTAALAAANDLAVAIMATNHDVTLTDISSGWTALTKLGNASANMHCRYKILSSAAAVDYQGTLSVTGRHAESIVTYKNAVPG